MTAGLLRQLKHFCCKDVVEFLDFVLKFHLAKLLSEI